MPILHATLRPAARAAALALVAAVPAASISLAQGAQGGGMEPYFPGVQDAEGAGAAASLLSVGPAGFGDGARVRERQSGLRVWSPEFLSGRIAFRAHADYAYTRYSFDGLPTRPRDLHHLHVPLRWRDRDDRWLVMATPLIATSSNVMKDFLNRGSRDDLDLHLRFQAQRWLGERVGWRLALVRDDAFGAPRVYPAAALLLKGRRVQAELGLPSSQIDWQVRDRLVLGAAVFPTGGSWHVLSDERGGAEFNYRSRAWRGAFTAQWQPWRWLRASAQAGLEFRRRYEFEDDTGAAIDRKAGSAGYLRLELRFLLSG